MATRYQTQEEANAFWAPHDYKKWVVTFARRFRKKQETRDVYVGAPNRLDAIRLGRLAADLLGHPWCKKAEARARLATAYDLGCVYVGEKGGA